jgi:hypothetical protein
LPWLRPVDPAPSLLVLPPDAASLDEADAAIKLWEHYKRRTLDPWQCLSVQLKMATRSDGRWAALTTAEEVGRQAGKGDAEEVVELWGLVQRAERILHTIHDAVLLATESHARMLSLIDGHADLRRKKMRAWSGTGQQMIEMRNGGIIWYRTRAGGGGGRGIDEVDRVVIDEGQHADLGQVEAYSPTQLMSVNPQTNVMGTGALEGKSAWWWSLRRRGLMPNPGAFSYLGFTAEKLSVVDERIAVERPDISTLELFLEQVRRTHPVLRRRPDKEAFLAEEYRKLGAEAAAVEYLCFWAPEPLADAPGVIDMSAWTMCARGVSTVTVNRTLALAVSPDQRWASLAVAGRREDGLLHVDVVDRRPGTSWLVDRIVEAWEEFRVPLRVASRDRNTLAALLRERGVSVVEVPVPEVAQGVGLVRSLVESSGLVHLGRRWLTDAVKVARLATSGLWIGEQIDPLEAVTLAVTGVPVNAPTRSAYEDRGMRVLG